MSTFLSEQVTKIDSVDFDELQPDEAHGRVRIAFFKYTIPATGFADGDTIALCEIPKGVRVIGGRLCTEAMGTAASGIIGITGSTSKYLGATSIAAISNTDFANTIALNMGARTTAKERLNLIISGVAATAGKIVQGYVKYVLD